MNAQAKADRSKPEDQPVCLMLSSKEQRALEQCIIEKLKTVIDPETGVNVIRMRLVPNVAVDETGNVHYSFRPSSPLCPLAVPLAMALKQTVAGVEGVTGQKIQVEEYIQADQLTEMINAWETKGDKTG